MAFKDNRGFIDALDRTGDVVRIKNEVDWDLEVGAIVRHANEIGAPAPLFEKLKDYPKGYRIFGAPLSTYRRLAISLGLRPETSPREMQDEYERRIQNPIKPVIVKKAPCKENIMLGKDVDLFRFPVPMIHDGDGGRFIGTWHVGVCKDPDSDWTNWGMYRLMVLGPKHMGGQGDTFSDQGRIFYGKFLPNHRNMPVAIAIGADPLSSLVSGASFRIGENEADFAGGLRQEPVELVKCETNDLLVPAYSEIVLEGEIVAGVRVDEGPFGEFTGYRTPRSRQILYKVNAITHRNNPILTMSCMGMPVDDASVIRSIDTAIQIKRLLNQYRIPYTDVCVPAETGQHLAVIGIKKVYNYNIAQIQDLICVYGRIPTTIVVDDDVDVFNMNAVMHALVTKCHPARGIRVREGERVIPLTPYLSLEEAATTTGPKVLFDCTWPFEWSKETRVPPRITFDEAYPEAVKQKVLQHWSSYGF